MIEMLEQVANGRWFKDPSPFRCVVQPRHPRLCVITGPNASGKSLLRKVLHNHYHDLGIEYIHTSQEKRSTSTGFERLVIYGNEREESTGRNSVQTLLKAIQTGQSRSKKFVLYLDEPEIGCSEEVQGAIGRRIGKELDSMPNLEAMYVVTHSRELARQLLKATMPTHWRLGGDTMTLQEWAFRTLPIDMTELEDVIAKGREGWHAVSKILDD